jgi:hypothetical protein
MDYQAHGLNQVVILVLSVLACASDIQAQTITARTPWYNPRDVRLDIETRRSTYRIGDSIDVRLTLRNTSDHPVIVPGASTNTVISLRVLDIHGREVKPTGAPAMGEASGLATLEAQQKVVLYSQYGQEWINLGEWGYELARPGSYTIIGLHFGSAAASITIKK